MGLLGRGAWLAIVPLRSVTFDFGVQDFTLLLHFRSFFLPVYQIRTKRIQFVIQSDELIHEVVFYLTVHYDPLVIIIARASLPDAKAV